MSNPKHICKRRCSVVGSGEVLLDTRGPSVDAPPVEFDTGMGAVPEAIDMAVRLMTPEETSLIRSAPKYAYEGRQDRPEVGFGLCPP